MADLTRGLGDTRVDTTAVTRGEETATAAPALIALYRAAQEGLTNVRKHAAARRSRSHWTWGSR